MANVDTKHKKEDYMKLRGLFFLILTPMLLFAQAPMKEEIPLSKSSRALQFQVGGLFTLSPFQGAAISYKYHIQQYSALRFGLSISVNGINSDGTSTSSSADTVRENSENNDDHTNIDVSLNLHKLWYIEPASTVLFFYGAGPMLGFNYYNQTRNELIWNSALKTTSENRYSWSMGLTGFAGVEWFASKTISFHAEYGLTILYSWGKIESSNNSPDTKIKNETTNTSWQISSRRVLFGISVYFK
jgi:hypothetical protein